MQIETHQDLQAAIDRLTRRAPVSLTKFITSLAFDTGAIGEQVRTFIVGDDLAETTLSLEARIDALRSSSRRNSRRRNAAAKSLPTREVSTTLQRLIAEDRYGTREPLATLTTPTGSE